MCELDETEWRQVVLMLHVLLEYEQGNIHEGLQGNWLAKLESWQWEVQCLYYGGGGSVAIRGSSELWYEHTSGRGM